MNRPDLDAQPAPAGVPSPLFSLHLAVPNTRRRTVEIIAGATGGRTAIAEQHDEPHTGLRQILLHTDSDATLGWLRHQLRTRLGADLLDLRDAVFARARRGKLAQRVTIPLSSGADLAMIHPSADARIRAHLAEHPEDLDTYTGRRRRVALVSDASSLPEGTDPAAALVGLESVAAFLHHHSQLDITAVPVDTRHSSLADTVAALSPGFAAICLHHTRPESVEAARRRLHRRPVVVLDTANDATAVTLLAALINAVQRAGTHLAASRIIVIDPHTAPDISVLLTAAGSRHLTFADSRQMPAAALIDLAEQGDVLIDLSGIDAALASAVDRLAPPRIALTLSDTAHQPRPDAVVATTRPGDPRQLHPLLALPGLLTAAVRHRNAIDLTARLAAGRALVQLAGNENLLPDPLDARVTAAVSAAVAPHLRHHRPT